VAVEATVRNAEARVLLGFDFPLGYPRGFAAAMGLMDPPGGSEPWLATLQHVAQAVVDDEANRHNRDAFAAACNARIGGGGAGPFWGCHDGAESEVLPARRLGVFDYPYAGLAEWRHADLAARKVSRPQSVWKLNQGVAVGGQTITGLPRVAELLAEDPTRRWLWPFQTGWALPHTEVGVVIAEVFPSLVPLSPRLNGPRDRVQVLSLARDLAQRDAAGTLSPRFAPPRGLDPTALNACRHEEGWILGL